MKAIKAIFKNKLSRIWFIVTSIVLALIIVVNIVGGVVFYDLLCIVLGRGKPVLAETDEDAVFYESDYFNKNDAKQVVKYYPADDIYNDYQCEHYCRNDKPYTA